MDNGALPFFLFFFLAGEECACSVVETNELTGKKWFISLNIRAQTISDSMNSWFTEHLSVLMIIRFSNQFRQNCQTIAGSRL